MSQREPTPEETAIWRGPRTRPVKCPAGNMLKDTPLTDHFVAEVACGGWRSQPHVAQAFAQEIERLRDQLHAANAKLAQADELLAEAAQALEAAEHRGAVAQVLGG